MVVITVVGSWFVARSSDDGGELRTAPVEETAPDRSSTSTTSPARIRVQRGEPRDGESDPEAFPVDIPPAAQPPPPEPPSTTPPIVPRPVPPEVPAQTQTSPAGYVATAVGCASGTSAGALDAFFRDRIGPVIGHDYQHVYDLGGDRRLWLFQDAFLDHGGTATRLDRATFAHNTALLQEGSCFTLLHRGSSAAPTSFEPGTGERRLSRWFWPLGGETRDGELHVFWAEMSKTADPTVPDGLGWVPVRTWLATYRTSDLARIAFRPAPASGTSPIYGYAVASDDAHSYLFGNSFDQNLARQGGYWSCPCSATVMWLARVPRGQLTAAPEYWTGSGWSGQPSDAQPISRRFHAENPMQPRFLDGRWVAATKVDGYWGEELAIDVATEPWGPWTTVIRRPLAPRGGDPLMNTYHAHLMPWLDGGALVVSVSQNARDMGRHAFPHPERYRLQFTRRRARGRSTATHDRVVDADCAGRALQPTETAADRADDEPTTAPTAGHRCARNHGDADNACTADDHATTAAPLTTNPCQTTSTTSTSSTTISSTTTDDDHRILDDLVTRRRRCRADRERRAAVRPIAPAAPRPSPAVLGRRSCDTRRPAPLHAPPTAVSRRARPRPARHPGASAR